MFQNEELQNHLETSSMIRSDSAILVEWNLNLAENIRQTGNYRFRPQDSSSATYKYLAQTFTVEDGTINTPNFYWNATDANTVVFGGFTNKTDNNGNFVLDGLGGLKTTPVMFSTPKEKEKLLYSLDDCLHRFRPRSGINKLRYFANGKYTHHANIEMARRPRYYIADRSDNFKYWSSYRHEDGVERGISNRVVNGSYYIDDAVPYVVYNNSVPANRLIVKMQTNVGDLDMGTFENNQGQFSDPFYGLQNQTTPSRWKVQYLSGTSWIDAIAFQATSMRKDGTSIIGPDGYVELSYGLVIPDSLQQVFNPIGEYSSVSLLPTYTDVPLGYAYLVKTTDTDPGTYYVRMKTGYSTFKATYSWYLQEQGISRATSYVTDLTSPKQFINPTDGKIGNREFQYIDGIRVVVETMNKFDCSFDLIEFSPRLIADISGKVKSVSVTKSASDLGVSGMPVGQLLASTGTLDIFDYDQAFFPENTNSVVSGYTAQHFQVKVYEIVSEVNGYDYYIPIKTLYSEGFPSISSADRTVSLTLRDLFFYFESLTAPQLLLENVSLSSAISMLLDYCGFSNYVFKRVPNENEMIIPFFSVAPDTTIAQVLSALAVSSQSTMFFDEDNNFVVMSKGYIMPTMDERPTDITLYGSEDFSQVGILKNAAKNTKLANIIDLSSKTNTIYNDGVINYKSAYIQRSYAAIKQASVIDRDKTWIYKPSLLWEVSASVDTKSINEETKQQSGYALSAIPLNSDISVDVPSVANNRIINNVIDLGDGIYSIARNNGFFYANGEVLKYDAVQYSVPGLTSAESILEGVDGDSVWITSTQEYEKYFAKVPFNGKIYPTGLIRVYAEPNYEIVNGVTRLRNGEVAKHGRGQFGTTITEHSSGLSSSWSSEANLRGCTMHSEYLFSSNADFNLTGVYSNTNIRGVASFLGSETILSATLSVADSTALSPVVVTSVSHGLNVGDAVYFSTAGLLPTAISNKGIYFVHSLITADSFYIYTTDPATTLKTVGLSQSGQHSITLVVKATPVTVTVNIPTTGSPTIFTTSANHGLSSGEIFYLTTTGTMPAGLESYTKYWVSVGDPQTKTFTATADPTAIPLVEITTTTSGTGTLSLVKTPYPVVIGSTGHRVIPGDLISFQTTGILPTGIIAQTAYSVTNTGFSDYSFMISATPKSVLYTDPITGKLYYSFGNKVALSTADMSASSGIHTLYMNTTENISKTQIVVSDTTKLAIGQTVEIVSGMGSLKQKTKITSIDSDHKTMTISPQADVSLFKDYIDPLTGLTVVNVVHVVDRPDLANGKAGISTARAKETKRTGTIKNFLSNTFLDSGIVKPLLSTQTGTVQSSALVMTGGEPLASDPTPGFISYIYKNLEDRFVHFGTRLRIVGTVKNDQYNGQSPDGVMPYYTSSTSNIAQPTVIGGASGGLAILVNPETNSGYYFEISALTQKNLDQYSNSSILHNMLFYKIQKNANASADTDKAIPVKLWGGLGNIIVDDGLYTGQYRMTTETNPTVYDLAVEYKEIGKGLRFFLYVNNVLVATVDDIDPPMIGQTLTVNQKTLTSTLATIQTSVAHGVTPGSFVNVSIGDYRFDGRRRIDSVTNTTMSYSVPQSAINVYSSSLTSNVATLVTDSVHDISVGAQITVSSVGAVYNGTFTVTKVTNNSLSYSKTNANISEALGGGTVTLVLTNQTAITVPASPAATASFFSDISVYNNMALFIRGSSNVMFENVYALANNYSQNTTFSLGTMADSVFSDNEINASDSFNKYALSGIIKSTYLSGLGSTEAPKYKIYFEEFGTILREAAHFDIRYDKAYPALYAKIAPTFNQIKGYTVSGFIAGSYGAEFLIFNATDTILNLDSTSGNYLRILGVTFTQTSQNQLTVDEYFSKKSDLSNPQFIANNLASSPIKIAKDYSDIKFSRMTYGKKQFSLDATYIQKRDDADNLMSWLMSKLMSPRKSVGLKVFGLPTIQLGDIVSIDYTNKDGINEIGSITDRFVVYSIEYSKKEDGPSMILYLSGIA